MIIGNQYLRSASVQVPHTPDVYASVSAQPHVKLIVDVNARQLHDLHFEVTLVLRGEGQNPPATEGAAPTSLYEAAVAYAGVFIVGDHMQEKLEPLLLVEAPRILFSAARSVLLNLIREAGFPVVNFQPVDFVALWHDRRKPAAQG